MSRTAARKAGSVAFSVLLWTKTCSPATSGKALSTIFVARPESPTPRSFSASVCVPTLPPIMKATMTNASHPKMAVLRCAALQRPARAAKFLAGNVSP